MAHHTQHEQEQHKHSLRAEAATLLSLAREQLSQISRALSLSHGNNSQLSALDSQARDTVSQISSAASAGHITPELLAALASGINIGFDPSALVAEAAKQAASEAVSAQLAAASADSHKEMQVLSDDVFNKHIFDRHLKFKDHNDEEAYRKHEKEDQEYIKAQLKHGTPEGDLNASGRMQHHMLDAHAHGAGDSPEFMSRWEELKAKTQRLRDSMRAAGKSTAEFDKEQLEDVKNFLKNEGLSEDEIKKRLAASKNPLDAVEPFLKKDKASFDLFHEIRQDDHANITTMRADAYGNKGVDSSDQPLNMDVNAMNAKLAAKGLSTAVNNEPSGHGLTVQKPVKDGQSLAV